MWVWGREVKENLRLMRFGASCKERTGQVLGSQTLLGLLGARGQEMTCRRENVRTGMGPHATGGVSEVMQRNGPLEKAGGEARRLGCYHTLRATTRVIPHSRGSSYKANRI